MNSRDLDKILIEDIKAEIERLLNLYEPYYDKLVANGRADQSEASLRLDLLRANIVVLEIAQKFGAAEVKNTLKRLEP